MNQISAVRIELSAYTASFRVPYFVGYQLTLTVPPLSTIFGLISSAAGRWVTPDKLEWLAYRFTYEGKAMDIETIHIVKPSSTGAHFSGERNVIHREFLVAPYLTLFLPPEWETYFQKPRYSLLFGRTQDVATVESICKVTLKPVSAGTVSGVLLPFELVSQNRCFAWMHSLPIAFTNDPQRRPLGVGVFGVIDFVQPATIQQGEEWLFQEDTTELIVPRYRKEWILWKLNRSRNQGITPSG